MPNRIWGPKILKYYNRHLVCQIGVCQIGVFIEDPLENSMASFNFNYVNYVMPNKHTTFIFGSWVSGANGSSGFNSHLVDTREPEELEAKQNSDLDVCRQSQRDAAP